MKKELSPAIVIAAIVLVVAVAIGAFLKFGAGPRVNLNAPRPKGPPSAPPVPKAGEEGPGSLPWATPAK